MNNLELPKEISWEELGHHPDIFQAFGPDYVESDIGKDFDLTITLFGYQLGEEEVKKLVDELKKHLLICSIQKWAREER